MRGLGLPDVPPVQDLLSLPGLKLLHLVLCRVEEAAKADNYEESKKKDYYQLPIPRANIHFLQTWEETLRCWEKVLQVSVTWAFTLQGQGAETSQQAGTRGCMWAAAVERLPPQVKASCFL